MTMAEFDLYCFGESGNAYKAALMLELCGLSWDAKWVDFFNGETRTAEYRENVNEMGEAPVLVHEGRKYSQSGVILTYLADRTRKFGAKSDDERLEILRWMLFDNHKFTASIAALRYLISLAKTGETAVTEYQRGRALSSLKIVDGHLAKQPFLIGKRATIADFSLCGYLFYGDELPIDMAAFTHVQNWLDRIKGLSGWKGPYQLMPRAAKSA
jgi:glutathione S-transferase